MDDKKTVIIVECVEENDGGVKCKVEATHVNARMASAAVLALVKSIAEDCGYGSLRQTTKAIKASLDTMVEVEEENADLDQSESTSKRRELWEAEIHLQADRNANTTINMAGELTAMMSLIITAIKKVAKMNNVTITEIQRMVDEGLHFLAVQEGEVKPTAEDRKTALNVSFIKKMLFNE